MHSINVKPLVIIGLDGADWGLINPWIEGDKLPALKKIKSGGVCADMISTIPPVTGPALASFFTGANPDNTGITGFVKPGGGIISYRDIKQPAIWDYLGSAGVRSCVVGLRLTYPPRKINGIMLSGGLLRPRGDDYILPEEYIEKARGYHPDTKTYPVLHRTMKGGTAPDPARLTGELIALTKKQFAVFESLRGTEDFPFSIFWVENTDLLQHFCWHKPEEILRLYQCLDYLIGEFVKKNPAVNLLLMSDHGFSAAPERSFYINGWLMEEGYLRPDRRILTGVFGGIFRRLRKGVAGRISFIQKRRMRIFLEKVGYKKRSPSRGGGGAAVRTIPLKNAALRCNFEPGSAVAYAPEIWGIRININSNEADYGKTREKLISGMKALLDRDGRHVFTVVCRKEDIYSGRFIKEMPDILFLTDSRYHIDVYAGGKRFGRYKSSQRTTGSHDQSYTGIMTASGPDVNRQAALKKIRIIDFMPTILGYFNISCPDGIDGKPASEIFGAGGRGGKIVIHAETAGDAGAYSPAEEAEIRKNLKNLGYL